MIILGREESVYNCTLPFLPFFCCLLCDINFILYLLYNNNKVLKKYPFPHSAGIFKHSLGARNRVGIGLSYRPTRLHRLLEMIPWNRFLGSLKVLKFGLRTF
jgi:hypothetical protein